MFRFGKKENFYRCNFYIYNYGEDVFLNRILSMNGIRLVNRQIEVQRDSGGKEDVIHSKEANIRGD